MKSRLYIFLLLNCMGISAASGLDFSGRVIEIPENIPSVGTQCNLQDADSVYLTTQTDSSGMFSFCVDSIPTGMKLCIIKENFEPLAEEISSTDCLNTNDYFITRITTLKEFSVEASAITTANGNMLYTPPKSVVESSSYAIDMLGKLGIPGLIYNPMSRSVSTVTGSPVILIDGVPSSQDDLKYLKPSRILNVEYSDVVPAKFASMGTSLINIRLKKRENGGDFNVWDMNDFTGNGLDASLGFNFHQEASIWKLYSDFSYRNKTKVSDTQSIDYMNEKLPLATISSANSPFNYKTNN